MNIKKPNVFGVTYSEKNRVFKPNNLYSALVLLGQEEAKAYLEDNNLEGENKVDIPGIGLFEYVPEAGNVLFNPVRPVHSVTLDITLNKEGLIIG